VVIGAVFVGVLAVVGTTPVALPLGAGSTVALTAVTLAAGAALSIAVYALAIRPFAPRESAWGGAAVLPGSGPSTATLSRLAASPLRRGALGWAAGGLAAGVLIRELLGSVFPQQSYALPDPLGSAGALALGGGVTLPVRALEVLAVGLAVGVVVERALAVTGAGAVMRAVADDAGAAALLGVPTERVVLAAFALAGALAGLAGLLIAPQAPIGLEDGVLLGLKGMTAALLLRLGSLRLALAGGLVVGAVEGLILATPSLGAGWADMTILAALAALAALRR
jgi:branched-subunit amino acid ABC-type transport system permease component